MIKKMMAIFLCAAAVVSSIPSASAANTVPATPTRDKGQGVYLGDTRVYPTGYNIANNNYFKLRDVGTLVGFGVEWNGQTQTVEISTERIPSSTEGIADQAVNGAVAKLSSQRITVDGTEVQMTAYQIGGNNYIKLRDIGKAVNFDVSFDSASRRITLNKEKPYQEPASGNAITSWNSTMQKFHAAMADCNWQAEKYLAVAEQYAPAITGKQNGTVRDVIAALDSMKGAPVDAISFDDKPVSVYWANELRKALGDSTEDGHTEQDDIPRLSDEDLHKLALEVVELTNAERAKAGLPAYTVNEKLMKAAMIRAKESHVNYSHTRPDGQKATTVLEDVGISLDSIGAAFENLGGRNTPEEAIEGWMNSEGHRNGILNIECTQIGVGVAQGKDGSLHWVQWFIDAR